MADEFDLKKAFGKAGKNVDAKNFANLDRFVKEVDKLQEDVDEIHRARNKILTSLARGGGADDRAMHTYDTLTKTVVKEAAKLRPQIASYQQAAENQIKALKAAKNAAGAKLVGELDDKLDAVAAFLNAQKKYPDSGGWLLASLGGRAEADSGPGKRKGEVDPSTLPDLKHAVKINPAVPGSTLHREIEWFEKEAEEIDFSALKKVKSVIPKLDAVTKQHMALRADIKAYLDYLLKPTPAAEAAVAAKVAVLDKFAKDALAASDDVEAVAVAIRKLPRKTRREKAASASLMTGVAQVERIIEECWQSLRPTGSGWTTMPSDNLKRVAKVA